MADQWRRQACGFMGEDPVKTPNLDALAAQSMVFTRAYCAAAVCTPARGSILTGRYPQSNGIINNGTAMHKDETTIAHVFRNEGYSTGYIGKWHVAGRPPSRPVPPGERGGFEYWCGNNCSHDNFQMHHTTGVDTPVTSRGFVPDLETNLAIDYIRRTRERPFLLFVSWAPPHPGTAPPDGNSGVNSPYEAEAKAENPEAGVYAAPKEFTSMYTGVKLSRPNIADVRMTGHVKRLYSNPDVPPPAGYFGAITALDRNLGRLMRALEAERLRENTIVVFTSDHGEMMMSHGLFGKHVWWEESISIPFMVNWPKRIPAGKCGALFNQPDIMPTLLSLAGMGVPDTVEGRDFSPALRGKRVVGPEATFVSIFDERDPKLDAAKGWRCIRTAKYLYAVEAGRRSAPGTAKYLFDMEADPYQMKPLDVSGGKNPVAQELSAKLRAWLVAHDDPFAKLV